MIDESNNDIKGGRPLAKNEKRLKERIVERAGELVDCVERIGKTDYFEINIRHVNGEIISKTEFSEKEKIK
jgi:hypothetical protein